MPSPELLPVLAGLVLGSVMAAFRTRRWSLPVAVLLGVLATIASGEHTVSWAFVLLDAGIVGASAVAGFLALRWARSRSLNG